LNLSVCMQALRLLAYYIHTTVDCRYNTVWVIENYDKAADKEYCASDSNSSK